MAQSTTSAPSLGKAAAELWRTLSKDLFDTYHPERYYMRGPGPKWHAKHAAATSSTTDLHGLLEFAA
jgi:hypothetical protein